MKYSNFNSLFAVVLIALSIYACQSTESETKQSFEVKKSYSEVEGEVAKTVANLSIEGMSCEQFCGSAISKCVKGVDGVIAAEVLDFDKERDLDLFAVTYDPNVTNEDELIKSINSSNKGSYVVKEVEVVTVTEAEIEADDTQIDEEASISFNEFRFPNISDIFEHIIR